jgi:hypothetical protein
MVEMLAEPSELIVVGEVVRQNLANSRSGVIVLTAQFPFEVKVIKSLRGGVEPGRVVKVGLTRDEAFFYQVGAKYLFFLKPDPEPARPVADPLTKREWRAVSDHFGIQPLSTALEGMVAALEARLLSCQNHRAHLVFSLRTGHRPQHGGELPYERGVPGHVMLAKYAATQVGSLNCQHGAPGARVGGWQAVNLPPDKWGALRRVWNQRYGKTEIPFFWCGRRTGQGRRVLVSARWMHLSDGEGWEFEYTVAAEPELRARVQQLGECLAAIGADPLSLDVPGSVDWEALAGPTGAGLKP